MAHTLCRPEQASSLLAAAGIAAGHVRSSIPSGLPCARHCGSTSILHRVSGAALCGAGPHQHPRIASSHVSAPHPRRKLGCTEGRSSQRWVDFNLFGHQVVAHLVDGYQAARSHNQVDGDPVPVPHFGLALSLQQFDALAQRCRQQGVRFVIEPHLRFQGACGAPPPASSWPSLPRLAGSAAAIVNAECCCALCVSSLLQGSRGSS